MIRILLFTLAVVAAAAGLAWFADRPGAITVEWLGYQVETTAFVATLAIGAAGRAADAAVDRAALSVHPSRGDRGACARAAAAAGLRRAVARTAGDRRRRPHPGPALCRHRRPQFAARAVDGVAPGADRPAQGRPGRGTARLRGHARSARDRAAGPARPVSRSQARRRQRGGARARRAGGQARSAARLGRQRAVRHAGARRRL